MSIKRILTFPGQGQTLSQTYLSQLQTINSTALNISLLKENFSKSLGKSFTNKLLQPHENYSFGNFLDRTSNLQPAVVGISCQIIDQIKRREIDSKEFLIKPDFVMGHSLGELSALYYNELFDLELALYLAKKRGKFMEKCVGIWGNEKKLQMRLKRLDNSSGLIALIIPKTIQNPLELIQQELDNNSEEYKGKIFIANHNSPTQLVLSGNSNFSLLQFTKILQKKFKIKSIQLKSQVPFHSNILEQAEHRFLNVLESQGLIGSNTKDNILKYPIISNLTGKITYYTDEALLNFVKSFTKPVLFMESMENLRKDFTENNFEFWSIGPNAGVNQGLIKANFTGDNSNRLLGNHVFTGIEPFDDLFTLKKSLDVELSI